MISETLSSGTLTRFWSYQVASRLPSAASTRVRWASGSAVRSSGSLSMLSATLRAPKPATAANGMREARDEDAHESGDGDHDPEVRDHVGDAGDAGRGEKDMASRVRDRRGALSRIHADSREITRMSFRRRRMA